MARETTHLIETTPLKSTALSSSLPANILSYISSFWVPTPPDTLSSSAPELPPLREVKQSGILVLNNPNLRFKDGSMPITYKLDHGFMLRLMKLAEEKLTPNKNSLFLEDGYLPSSGLYKGLSLRQIGNNQWEIYDNASGISTKPTPHFSYAFVTMPDKSIRVIQSTDTIHLQLSHTSPVLRYAGNVTFNDRGEIDFWDNASGNFQPSADLKKQAGFYPDDVTKFRNYYSSQTPTPGCKQ